MHVATDGNYNMKILNDAFEGRAHENEEIELVKEAGEMKVKKRTKRPPATRPEAQTASVVEEEKREPLDPRVSSIVEDVMRRS